MIRKLKLFFFLLNLVFVAYAQPSKSDANSNFDMGNYEIALNQYLRLLKADKTNALFHYRIGICYLNTCLDRKQAIPYLLYASKDPKINQTVFFDLGKSYFHAMEFDSALFFYNKYQNIPLLPDSELTKVKKHIRYIDNAKELMKRPVNVTFVNLGENINTKRSDYNPYVTNDESVLFYTSNRKYISDFQQLVNGIYWSKGLSGGRWQKAKSLGSKVNTDEDIKMMGMSKDGNCIYAQPESYSYFQDLYQFEKTRGRYGEATSLGSVINTKKVEVGVSTTLSGDTLYFSSNRDGGFGGMDIYYSLKLPNGNWGTPQNLGPDINTADNESYPEISRDSRKLYFASDGYNSMGGYDIFVSKLEANGKWGKPKNLGYPINDTYDNNNISITDYGRYGYVALTRPEGYGDLDIYKVIFNTVEQQEVIFKGTIAAGDSLHSKPLKGINPDITISVNYLESKELFGNYNYNQNTGKYIISLPPGKFELIIEGDGYQTFRKELEVHDGIYADRESILNIWLKTK
jgi:tetratricopeptide (TPR) repeat protein